MNFRNFRVFTIYLIYSTLLILVAAGCVGGKSSSSPSGEGTALLPLAPKLDPPKILAPTIVPYPSNKSLLAVSGSCTTGPGAKVYFGGDENLVVDCSSNGDYLFNVSKTNDGVFNYSLHEESFTLHPSDEVPLIWMRSTVLPPSPTVTTPSTGVYTSNQSNFQISGSCGIGSSVDLSGDSVQTTSCSAQGSFSFSVNKVIDGTYVFQLSQTDIYGNTSNSSSVNWTRNTVVPPAPVLTAPNSNPFLSSDSSLLVSGSCTSGLNIQMSGAATDTVICANGAFSFLVSESTSGNFSFDFKAISPSGTLSTAANFVWNRDATVPATPTLSSPNAPHVWTSGDSLNVSGSCTTGNTVYLTGSSTANVVCSANSFSFTLNELTDGSTTYGVYQKSPTNISSGSAGLIWTRDTLAPSAPVVTTPASSPFLSKNQTLAISGSCESGAQIGLSGDLTNFTTCVNGTFSINLVESVDGTFNFQIKQTDLAGNQSTAATVQWVLDTTIPLAPVITLPATPNYISNTNSITIGGTCENGNLVGLSGSSSGSFTCASHAFSFTVNKTTDATYSFVLDQTDPAGNISTDATLTWTRDVVAPMAPTILSPAQNPFTSSDSIINVQGACEVGASVFFSGAASGSVGCSSGTYSIPLSKSVDGTYNLSLYQADLAGNSSSSSSFQWIRLSTAPVTPVLTSPLANPFYSNTMSLTISGSCTTGANVEISGAASQVLVCAAGAYSFFVSNSSDGTYSYNVIQYNVISNPSSAAQLTWIIDTVAPATPVVTTPATNVIENHGNSLTVSGVCESGSQVNYVGSASGNLTCSSNAFSFSYNNTVDGSYVFSISQTDLAGNTSSAVVQTWNRDTLAPSTPSLTQPGQNPFVSGDSSLSIAGNCEMGASVNITGDLTANMSCTNAGQFVFTSSKTIDAIFNYGLTQTDAAGNVSGTLSFQWTRDTTKPFTPGVSQPAMSPYYSNGNTLTIVATCDATVPNIVHLTGDLTASDVLTPSGLLDQTCTASPVTYVVQKTLDGTFNLSLSQENPGNSLISADAVVQWVRDSIAPAVPVLTSPSSSPYTAPGSIVITGNCEANATVSMTGDSTQSQICASNAFSFSVVKSVDATYNFALKQTDLAANSSATVAQVWTRNSNSVPPPTISFPATNPYLSNGSSLTISGGCTNGYTVTLGGAAAVGSDVTNPAGSLTQACAAGAYSFTISKAADSTYAFSMTESLNGVSSSAVNLNWTRDTLAPTTTLTTTAANPNLAATMSLSFTASESSVTFQCKLDAGTYVSCTSPVALSSIANGSHTYYVKATDPAGNLGAASTYTWTQASYKTIGLYHFASSNPTADSGYFTSTAAFINNLTAVGSPTVNSTGKFPTTTPSSQTLGTSKYFSLANNAAINSASKTMTIEGFVNFSALTTTAN